MKRTFATLLIIAAISLTACNDTVPEYDKTLPAVQPDAALTLPSADSVNKNVVLPQNSSSPIQAKDVQSATAALNPAHGQPGHRCDIAVGAPLNSGQAAAPAAPKAAPVQLSTPLLPASAGSSVTLNPPHGQPGHDCAIPVGQPLKS